jgi:hypothetical protein
MRKQTALLAAVVLVVLFGVAAAASITLESLDARVSVLEGLHGIETTTSTTSPATTTSTAAPTTSSSTTTTASPTTTAAPTTTTAGPSQHLIISEDTVVTERMVLRPGDTIEFRNGAGLLFGEGGSADWQGTETETWSGDGTTQDLDRDIRIRGHGHIRFEHGSEASTIRFVQIDLQPDLEVAEYPLHWHHAMEGSRGTLVEGVVVQNSTNRGFVPHASNGITFRDTIASNVTKSGYWWDPPPDSNDESNNSHDITYDHALVDGVVPPPGDPEHGRGMSGFFLSPGHGNTLRDSVAMNMDSSTKNSGCIVWPARDQDAVWTVETITAHDCTVGLWTWQNTGMRHIVEDVRTWSNEIDLSHGAYGNNYVYRNVDMDSVEIHATGWALDGGRASHVVSKRNPTGGTVTFRDVEVDTFEIRNADTKGDTPVHYVFDNTGLTFANVDPANVVGGTTVTIDGETRSY